MVALYLCEWVRVAAFAWASCRASGGFWWARWIFPRVVCYCEGKFNNVLRDIWT